MFSEMDGNDEFLRYSDSSPIKDTKSYIDALCKVPTTTTHVNIFIVKPDTLSAECCYAKKILKEDPQHAHELVGTPTLFLSHAWRYTFKTLMSALDTHFEDKSDSEKLACRVWNDIFVEDQNNVDSKPKDYFFTAFLNAVGSIGNTLLVSVWVLNFFLRSVCLSPSFSYILFSPDPPSTCTYTTTTTTTTTTPRYSILGMHRFRLSVLGACGKFTAQLQQTESYTSLSHPTDAKNFGKIS